MPRTIRARYSKGVIEPFEKLEIAEGEEITITIAEIPAQPEAEDGLDSTFGGWVGLVDAEKLKSNIYADRLIPRRREVSL